MELKSESNRYKGRSRIGSGVAVGIGVKLKIRFRIPVTQYIAVVKPITYYCGLVKTMPYIEAISTFKIYFIFKIINDATVFSLT